MRMLDISHEGRREDPVWAVWAGRQPDYHAGPHQVRPRPEYCRVQGTVRQPPDSDHPEDLTLLWSLSTGTEIAIVSKTFS